MLSMRKLERTIYPNPELDELKYSEFPRVDDWKMISMENSFVSESDKVNIFLYVSHLNKDIPFVDMYVWDYMLYPVICKRFVICEGLSLTLDDEKMFFHYIDNEIRRGQVVIHEEHWNKFCQDV